MGDDFCFYHFFAPPLFNGQLNRNPPIWRE